MTSRERFLTALSGGVPDRIPIMEHLFSLKLMQELLGYTTVLYDGKTQAKLAAKLGIDGIWTPINGFCGIEETPHEPNEIYKDEWGVTYQKNGWPIIAQIDTPVKCRVHSNTASFISCTISGSVYMVIANVSKSMIYQDSMVNGPKVPNTTARSSVLAAFTSLKILRR